MKNRDITIRIPKRALSVVGILLVLCLLAFGFFLFQLDRHHVPEDWGFHLYIDYSAYAEHPDGCEIVKDIGVYLDAELTQRLTSERSGSNLFNQQYIVHFSKTAEPTDTFYITTPTLKLGDITITPTNLPLRYTMYEKDITLILVQAPEDHVVPFRLDPVYY